jgi:hypothetical protein
MADRYRKRQMKKRGYSRTLYNQLNKNETIMSVIKRLFGWRMSYIEANKNTEQRTVIQMYRLQHAQANKSCDYDDGFYRAVNR